MAFCSEIPTSKIALIRIVVHAPTVSRLRKRDSRGGGARPSRRVPLSFMDGITFYAPGEIAKKLLILLRTRVFFGKHLLTCPSSKEERHMRAYTFWMVNKRKFPTLLQTKDSLKVFNTSSLYLKYYTFLTEIKVFSHKPFPWHAFCIRWQSRHSSRTHVQTRFEHLFSEKLGETRQRVITLARP